MGDLKRKGEPGLGHLRGDIPRHEEVKGHVTESHDQVRTKDIEVLD
jgi:hypothetical protein